MDRVRKRAVDVGTYLLIRLVGEVHVLAHGLTDNARHRAISGGGGPLDRLAQGRWEGHGHGRPQRTSGRAVRYWLQGLSH